MSTGRRNVKIQDLTPCEEVVIVLLLKIVSHWLHMISGFTWLGGLIFTNLVLTPAVAPKGIPPQFVRLMCMERFKKFAWGSIAVILVTGVFNTWAELPSLSLLFATSYGRVLAIKIALVLLMVGITLQNSLRLGPKLIAGAPPPGQAPAPEITQTQRRMVLFSYLNLGLALTVLLTVALLKVVHST